MRIGSWLPGTSAARVLLTALALAATPSSQASDEIRPAVIDFVSLGGIEDWRPEGSDAMLIRGRNGSWYRARFFSPCIGLRFRDSVAFVTDGTDRLDRFSSVLVDGQRCWFRSFEKLEAEPLRDSGK
jgi:hypothetical protein